MPLRRCGQRAFDGNAKFADGADGVVREPVLEFAFAFSPAKTSYQATERLPLYAFSTAASTRGRSFPDIAAGAVAFNEGMIG